MAEATRRFAHGRADSRDRDRGGYARGGGYDDRGRGGYDDRGRGGYDD